MDRFLYFLLALSLLFTACQDTSSTVAEQTQTAPAEEAPTAVAPSPQYPSVAEETIKMLWDSCDYIDFVFYATNFSMSQNQQPAIRTTLQGISTLVPTINPTCQPAGRIFFQVDGLNRAEADIYLGQDCLYYVWLENGQYTYANLMTEQGVAFYQNIFAQMQSTGGQ